MNRSIFWRLVWKEYRLQRALWIAIVVLTLLLQGIMVWTVTDATERVYCLFGSALVLTACYALGCGAVLFAAERETGTFEFQRAIPVSSARVFAAKVTYALASTLALILVLVFAAAVLSRRQSPDEATYAGLWATFGLGACEVLAWSIFFSLQSARPLLAAILGVTAASTAVHLIAWSVAPRIESVDYAPTVPYRVVALLLVALADLGLGLRWLSAGSEVSFGERLASWWRSCRAGFAGRSVSQQPGKAGKAGPTVRLPRGMMFGRLVWQQWRQSRRMIAALALLAVVVAYPAFHFLDTVDRLARFSPFGGFRFASDAAIALVSLLAALMGSCVFLGDQSRQGFRFLGEHAARPGSVWLSRQLVWLVPLAALIAVASWPLLASHTEEIYRLVPQVFEPNTWTRHLSPSQLLPTGILVLWAIGTVAVWTLVAYAAGQLCSMFFQSGILAAVFGVTLAAALWAWAWLMRFLQIDWRWSVVPIPILLLLATRLRTRDWMLQRNRFWGWLRVGLVLAVPGAAIVVSVPPARVSAIPPVPESFASECTPRDWTDEERQTEAMFERAGRLLRPLADFKPKVDREPGEQKGEVPQNASENGSAIAPPLPVAGRKPAPLPTPPSSSAPPEPWEIAWLKANGESVALTLQATRRPISNDPRRVRLEYRFAPRASEYTLMTLLVTAARAAQADGKLDEAMEHYLAALRLSRHIAVYHGVLAQPDESVHRHLSGWVAAPGQTADRVGTMLRELTKVTEPPVSRTLDIQENYQRARDLINGNPTAMANARLKKWDASVIALWNRWLPWERERALRVLDWNTFEDLEACGRLEADLERDASGYRFFRREQFSYRPRLPLTLALDSYLYRRFDPATAWFEIDDIFRSAVRRRAARLMLAIEARRLDKGRFPESLDVLVGPYLDRMPLDPRTGQLFGYYPDGLGISARPLSGEGRRIPANQPLLTSGRSQFGSSYPTVEGPGAVYAIERPGRNEWWYVEEVFLLPIPKEKAPAGGSSAPRK